MARNAPALTSIFHGAPRGHGGGGFILAGISTEELIQVTDIAIKMKQNGVLGHPCGDDADVCVSEKVVRIIQSYVNVVNKIVWRKE